MEVSSKKALDIPSALGAVKDGDVIFFGGFGSNGNPSALIEGLSKTNLKNLTIVNNGGGSDDSGLGSLLESGAIAKIICSFPYERDSVIFRDLFQAGKIELELVPQGTLAERIRNAGAGLGGFLTKTGLGTEVAQGKQEIEVEGELYILEKPLRADVALLRADTVDTRGNLTYRGSARNFNPVMAMAARHTIVQASKEVALGETEPGVIVTPGIYVDQYVISGGGSI